MTTIVTNDTAGEQDAEIKTEGTAEPTKVEQEVPAVEVSATDATESETSGESESESESGTEQAESKEQKKKLSGFQRRLQKFERQIQDAQIEAEYWKRQAMQQTTAQPTQTVDEEPLLKNFDNVEDYVIAREKYLLEKVVPQKVMELTEATVSKTTQSQAQNQIIQTYQQKVVEVQKEIADYNEVVADLPDLPLDMQEFLISSDVGPRLTYHLAQNEDLVSRLTSLSAVRRIAELGKLEEQVTPKAKKITAAPAVAPKIKATPAANVVTDLSQARNFQEYKAMRLKQLAERNKR
jgi:hypothetical protein